MTDDNDWEKRLTFSYSQGRPMSKVLCRGGHIGVEISERRYTVKIDDRRRIDPDSSITDNIESKSKLYLTEPHPSVKEGQVARKLAKNLCNSKFSPGSHYMPSGDTLDIMRTLLCQLVRRMFHEGSGYTEDDQTNVEILDTIKRITGFKFKS